nr:MBL fold metallo-hydrolase [uncultured Methanospirillum sp.]
MNLIKLLSVDHLEVTVLADNYTDMFLTQDTVFCRRPKVLPPKALLAEHGFSCILKVKRDGISQSILLDAGVNPACINHNAKLLGIDLSSLNSIIISHGHPDHFLGLLQILTSIPKKIQVMVHPDAFLEKRLNNHTGPVHLFKLDETELESRSAIVEKNSAPKIIGEGQILLTGEINQMTSFEKGFPGAEILRNGTWNLDSFKDEQSLVIHVKEKGLVIISGCAHTGIINTIYHASQITGIDKIHAVLGGFHLTGPLFEHVIQPTIDEMKQIKPEVIIPMHCTGWSVINRFMTEMPDRCLLNTVGSTYLF